MRKDHDRGNKGGGGGERKTETSNEFLSVKFDNYCKKSAKELVYLNGKIRSSHDNLKQAASMYSFRSDFTDQVMFRTILVPIYNLV